MRFHIAIATGLVWACAASAQFAIPGGASGRQFIGAGSRVIEHTIDEGAGEQYVARALAGERATRAVLFDNGPLGTGTVSGSGVPAPGGFQWSEVPFRSAEPGVANTTLGYGMFLGGGSNFRVADDFTVTGQGWTVNSIRVFGYQTGAVANPFSGANLQIWNGRPGDPGSIVLFGGIVTNVMSATGDANIYRVGNTTTPPPGTAPGTSRLVRFLDLNVGALVLAPGTYWIDWQATLASGATAFTPTITIPGQGNRPGDNGRQFNGMVWSDIVDLGNPGTGADLVQDLPFIIEGSIGPPATIDVNWAAAQSGMWSSAGNWNPMVVPNNGGAETYNAIINAMGANPYTVTLDLPVTVNALDLLAPNAELHLANQPLIVLGDFRLDSTATLSGLTPGSAEFNVGGDAKISGGTIAHVPNFNSNGRLLFLGSLMDGDAGPVAEICDSNVGHNGPQVKWTSFGADGGGGQGDVAPTIKLNMGAVFDHGAGSTFLIESDAVMMQQSVPTFTSVFNNMGILRKQTTFGTTDMLDFVFNNTGTVEVVTGTLRINGVPLPSGALQTGSWTVRTGASLVFLGQQVLTNQATILLDGPSSTFGALSALRTNSGSGVLEVRGRMLGVAPSTLTFTNSGMLRMGPGGLLSVSGFLSQQVGGTFRTSLNGAATTANYGRVAATSSASLSGALVVALEGGFNPDWGDTYIIATYASRTGNFTSFTFPGLSSPNLRWWRENNATTYRIGVRHVADTNHDGVVNFTDLNNVLSTFGQSGAGLIGDCDENGTVNFTDLNLVLSVFGQSAPPN